jgi:hypothetical protein
MRPLRKIKNFKICPYRKLKTSGTNFRFLAEQGQIDPLAGCQAVNKSTTDDALYGCARPSHKPQRVSNLST